MYIGALTATLGVDTVGLYQAEQKMKAFEVQTKASIARVNTSLKSAGASMKAFGKSANKYLTLPLALIGGAAVNSFRKYEASLAKITGLVGVAKTQVEAWDKEILKIGPSLSKGPNELAKALFFITSAGIRGANAMKVLKMSAQASAAGLGETKVVADLATSAINAYGESNLSAKKAMDILITTVREGKAEPAELASSMGMVLPIASAMKVKFNEVGAAMAGMTRTGTSASTAAMQLRQILAAFLKPTEKTKEILAGMGTSYKKVKEGFQQMGTSAAHFRDIIAKKGLLAALMELKNLSNEYGTTVMSKVFPNIRALSGVLDLLGSNMQSNVAIFDSLKNSTGNLDAALNAVKNTFEYKWNTALAQGKSALVTLGREVSKSFLPILESLTKTIEKVTTWFTNLSDSTKKFIVTVGGILLVVGPVATVLGFLAGNVIPGLLLIGGKLITMFNALKLAMLTNPITAWIAVAGVAAVLLYKLATNSGDAAKNQKKLNDEFERSKQLTAATKNLKDYVEAASLMNKRELEDVKSKIKSKIKVVEDYILKRKLKEQELQKKIAGLTQYGLQLDKKMYQNTVIVADQTATKRVAIAKKQSKAIEKVEVDSYQITLKNLQAMLNTIDAEIKKREGTKTIKIAGQVISIDQGKTIAELTNKLKILDNISKAYGGTISVLNDKTNAYKNAVATLISQGMDPMSPIIQKYIKALNELMIAQKKATGIQAQLKEGLASINSIQKELGSSYDATSAKLELFNTILSEGLKNGMSLKFYTYLTDVIKRLKYELAKKATSNVFKDVSENLQLASRNASVFGKSFDELNTKLTIYSNALRQLEGMKGPFTPAQLALIQKYIENIDVLKTKLEALSTQQKVFSMLSDAASQMFFQMGKALVDFSDGISGLVDIVLRSAEQIVSALLTTAMAAVIAKNAAMPWGLIGAAVGIGALTALWESAKSKADSAAHLAQGGVIPNGYANDTYPAMLSSHEVVIPLDKLPGLLDGINGGGEKNVTFKINGRVLEAIMVQQGTYNDVY